MPTQRKRFYKRWWFRILVVLLLGVIGFDFLERRTDARELQEALAEADRRFPGDWRLEDIIAKLPPATAPEKDPLRLLAMWKSQNVGDLLTAEIKAELELLHEVGPAVRAKAEQIALFRKTLKLAKPHLDPLEPFRQTRDVVHALDWNLDNYYSMTNAHVSGLVLLMQFNRLRTIMALEDNNEKDAIESCLAIHHSLSWLHHEPLALSQFVRMSSLSNEIVFLERMLAQRELPPEELKRFAELIEAEIAVDPIRIGLRAEMGGQDRIFISALAGDPDLDVLGDGPGEISPFLFRRYFSGRNRANVLRELGALREFVETGPNLVELTEFYGPFSERLRRNRSDHPFSHWFIRRFSPLLDKLVEAKTRFIARGQLAVAALAFERFHRERGKWPASWEELIPNYLASIPLDAWDGKPLRLKRTEKSIIIYTIGVDRTDEGEALNRGKVHWKGVDFGFELFDPEQRRQPAPPKAVEPDEKD